MTVRHLKQGEAAKPRSATTAQVRRKSLKQQQNTKTYCGDRSLQRFFFAGSCLGRFRANALQSAEQRCQGRYGRIYRVSYTSRTYDKATFKKQQPSTSFQRMQKRAVVKSYGKYLRRNMKGIDAEKKMALVKLVGKYLPQSQCARLSKMERCS